MQRLVIGVSVVACFFFTSCFDEELPVLYDTYVDVWIHDGKGHNLLDPTVNNHFDHADIRLYYVRGTDTTEVFHPRNDVPRNYSILTNTSNGQHFLRLLPDEGELNNQETITLIEWKPGMIDHLKCQMGRTQQAVFTKKIWYNNRLCFDVDAADVINWGDQAMGRFVEVVKGE